MDLPRLRNVWDGASDADVVRALNDLEDYPTDAVGVIKDEAIQRGLTADSKCHTPETYTAVRRVMRPVAEAAGRFLNLARAHPIPSGIAVGLLAGSAAWLGGQLNLFSTAWGWAVTVPAIYMGGIGAIAWPFRRYRAGLLCVAGAWVGHTAVSVPVFIPSYFPHGTPFSEILTVTLSAYSVVFCIVFLVPALLLSTVVALHNRYWPWHQPGVCRVCDYDLRGLPKPRCPECGTPFDPAEIAGVPTEL